MPKPIPEQKLEPPPPPKQQAWSWQQDSHCPQYYRRWRTHRTPQIHRKAPLLCIKQQKSIAAQRQRSFAKACKTPKPPRSFRRCLPLRKKPTTNRKPNTTRQQHPTTMRHLIEMPQRRPTRMKSRQQTRRATMPMPR